MQMSSAPSARPPSAATPSASPALRWTAARFFDLLQQLGRLRVISICGPSVFESLCQAGSYEIIDGSLNMVTGEFHWHVALERFRHLKSHEGLHARSGRKVLFFELRERADQTPFLRIYVYRAPGVEFEPRIEATFRSAHAELELGVEVAGESQ